MAANLTILDDLLARKYAKNFELQITGTLGILIVAKEMGLITSVNEQLDKLINIGMYVGENLYKTVLERSGEL